MGFISLKCRLAQYLIPLTYWILTFLSLYTGFNFLTSGVLQFIGGFEAFLIIIGLIAGLLFLRVLFEFFMDIHEMNQNKNKNQ